MPIEAAVERGIIGAVHKRVVDGNNKYPASIFQLGMIDISR